MTSDDVEDLMTIKLQTISLDEHYARLYGTMIIAKERETNVIIGVGKTTCGVSKTF